MKTMRFPVNIIITLLLLLPSIALAQQQGLGLNNQLDPFVGTASGPLIDNIQRIVNFFLGLIAILAGIMIIYGGVQYITAGLEGDSGQADKAKRTVVYAVIGILVIGLSAVIVNFALDAIPG